MILVAGEALVDLAADGDGRYVAHPGGGPANTAVALARLGVPVSFLGGVGDDGFGDVVRHHLSAAGVDLGLAVATAAPTTLAVASLDAAGAASYRFYLEGTSVAALTPARVPVPLPDTVDALWCGGLGLVVEPTATTLADLVRREADRLVVGVDPNVRPSATADLAGHLRRLTDLIAAADIVKLSDADAELIRPGADPADTAAWIHSLGPPLVLVTAGDAGVVAVTRHGTVELPVAAVPVADTIGAGDAYGAGILAALHDGGLLSKAAIASLTTSDVETAHDLAAAVAAVTVSRPGADPPWRSEL